MASNCQIPTPQEYVIHMLDYIGYSKMQIPAHLSTVSDKN